MADQPEALRLADWLEDQYDPTHNQEEAAAELRRLHAENERLTSLCYDYLGQITALRAAEQMSKQIAAISKAEGEKT